MTYTKANKIGDKIDYNINNNNNEKLKKTNIIFFFLSLYIIKLIFQGFQRVLKNKKKEICLFNNLLLYLHS